METDKEETPESILRFDYNPYPKNPFARSIIDKLNIILRQISDINERIIANGEMISKLIQFNQNLWSEHDDPSSLSYSSKSKDISERFKSCMEVMRVGHRIIVTFDYIMKLSHSDEDSSENHLFQDLLGNYHNSDMLVYKWNTKPMKYNPILLNGFSPILHCTNKENILTDHVDAALECISHQLYLTYIDLSKFKVEKIILENKTFPYLYVRLYIIKL